MDVPETSLLLLFIFFIFNDFLILLRTAVTQAHKNQLEKILSEKDRRLDKLCDLIDDPDDVLSCLIISSNICHFVVGFLVGINLVSHFYLLLHNILPEMPYAYEISLVVCIVFFLMLSILLGTLLPKKMAQIRPEYYLIKHMKFLFSFYKVTAPFFHLFSGCVNFLLLITGGTPPADENVTEDEVKDLIERATEEGTLEEVEQDMVDSIFHMSDQTAYSLMTPRTQLNWLDIKDTQAENLRTIKNTSDDIFLVGENSLDNLVGILYAKDILRAAIDNELNELEKFIKKPIFIPRSMETFRVIDKFRQNSVSEAVVTDEYGGVLGLITLKDIVEEIIGDVQHQREADTAQIIQRDENSWYVDGLYDIDDFKEKFDLDSLPGEERAHYQTVGGFLVSYFGYIPKTAEYKIWHNLRFEVADMDRTRIDKILVSKIDKKDIQ